MVVLRRWGIVVARLREFERVGARRWRIVWVVERVRIWVGFGEGVRIVILGFVGIGGVAGCV